jgi:hypothetical protein
MFYIGDLVVRLRSNRTKAEDFRAFTLADLSRTAIEQLAEYKAENVNIVACHFNSHSTEIATNELVNVVMYHQFLYFKSLTVIAKFISAVIICNALDLYSFL